MTQARPNILFLMSDQHRFDALGAQNPLIKTPNLDRLIQRGILFSQAVCNSPMCMPSRYSMMTGLYPSQSGNRHNTNLFAHDEDCPVDFLPEKLRKGGYQTAGFGKTHWYEAQAQCEWTPSNRGFEKRCIARGADSHEREADVLMYGEDEPQHWEAFKAEKEPYGPGEENILGYKGTTSCLSSEQFPEGWLTRQTLKFLREERDEQRPFFLYLSFDKPHAGLNVPAGFEELYRLEDIEDQAQPPWFPHEPSPSHGFHDRRSETWAALDPEERRRTTLRYYAMCSYVDHCFGQIIEELEQQGQLDNTNIVFTSDHGEMLGTRGWRFSKYNFYEGSVRVPLICAGPSIPPEQQGTIDDRCTELVDIVPTLSGMANLDIDPRLPGHNLLDPQWTRCGSFSEIHGKGYTKIQQAPAIMWRTPQWKLILKLEGEWHEAFDKLEEPIGELYDLQNDPEEWSNLFHDDSTAKVREKLTRTCLLKLVHAHAAWPQNPGQTSLTWPKS